MDGFTDWLGDPRGARFARSRLRLSGMHCAACAGLIEATLRAQPGVLEAQVNASTQGLLLDWRPEDISLDDLRQALSGAGYDFSPDLAGPTRALRQREHRQAIWRLFVAGFLMMQVMMLAWPSYVAAPGEMAPDQAALLRWGQWVLTLPVMLLSAGPFFQAALLAVARQTAGHGHAGLAGAGRGLRRRNRRHARPGRALRARGLLRLDHDVRGLPAGRAVSRAARAPPGRPGPGAGSGRAAEAGRAADPGGRRGPGSPWKRCRRATACG